MAEFLSAHLGMRNYYVGSGGTGCCHHPGKTELTPFHINTCLNIRRTLEIRTLCPHLYTFSRTPSSLLNETRLIVVTSKLGHPAFK